MTAGAVRAGRGVTVVGMAGLVALTGGWLLLDAGPLRTAVGWAAVAALAGCVLALTGVVLRAGRVTPAQGYGLALDAARAPAPGAGAALPAELHGSRWPWARVTAVALAVPTALVLFCALGAGTPDRGAVPGRIAAADYVIKELPVVAVGGVERAGSSSRASSEADYTVRLPAPHGSAAVPATFRAAVHRGVRQVGETLPVAYVPQRPGLGAVGADTRSAVEALLAGRTLPYGTAAVAGLLWGAAALAAVCVGTAVTGPPRRGRRMGKDWVALRVTAAGVAEHVERPTGDDAGPGAHAGPDTGSGPGSDSGSDSGSGSGKSSARYACLILHTDTVTAVTAIDPGTDTGAATGTRTDVGTAPGTGTAPDTDPGTGPGPGTAPGPGDVPLRLAASHRRAAPLLTGAAGWLLWKPAGPRGKVPADFVADDGWQLPGRLPAAEAARIAAARAPAPFTVDAARRTRLLELGSHWTRTVPAGVLLGAAVSVTAAGVLLLPVDGGWRAWTAVAGALAPLLCWMITGLFGAPRATSPGAPVEAGPPA
ncbi:hypothetical protein [Streptomyces lydicus]|uniref:hypothetical protein n=1 Tax=Streptomyces lydicus TaxID=47763 RepID=UPI00379C6A4D